MSDLGGTLEYSGRKAIAIVLCALFVITAFTGLSMNSSASTLTVKVMITHIHGIDWVDDSPNYPDFYWKVWLGGSSVPTADPYCTDLNDIYPNWPAYFFNLPAGTGQSYTLMIELWDDDGAGTASDDICDISKQAGGGVETTPRSSQAVMTYYIDTSSWIGDDSSSGDTNGAGHVSGEEDAQAGDYDDCELWFTAVTIPNSAPTATISSITPNPANIGTTVSFSGYGSDSDGTIVAYNWRSSINGVLSYAASFSTAGLSLGTHTIYFKVQDDDGGWSLEATRTLYIISNAAPTATISSISPSPASWGASVSFSGYGTDSDGTITGYNWRSNINGQLSTAASFSTSSLSAGTHTIYFKVMDDDSVWSNEVTRSLTVNPGQRDVTVTITHVRQIDKVDSGNNQADFYWIVTLAGISKKSAEPWKVDANDVYPNWAGTWTLTAGSGQANTLVIELWDDDGATGDDPCDIAIGTGIDTAVMTYYVDTNTWNGDDTSSGDANGAGHVSGDEDGSTTTDQDDCELWFTVVRAAVNLAPAAVIDSISPNPAMQGTTVNFNGHGTDTDGTVVAWKWRSSIDGQLSSAEDFSTSSLSPGTHTIYYSVCDNGGKWSPEVSTALTITSVDYDPTCNLWVTVTILEVWAIDTVDDPQGFNYNPADFYWTVSIAGQPSTSIQKAYANQDRIYPNWQFSADVADTTTSVDISITLWDDDGSSGDDVLDISPDLGGGTPSSPGGADIELTYDIRDGTWTGDDYLGDMSGKGRVTGNEDGSYTTDEDDAELRFTITQTSADGDSLCYWEETYTYGTGTSTNDNARNADNDGLLLWYEDEWGLSDTNAADAAQDRDGDGFTSLLEYQMSQFGTRLDFPDLLVEIDYQTNHRPQDSVVSYMTDYFRNRQTPAGYFGIRLNMIVDDEVPADQVDTNGDTRMSMAEGGAVRAAHFDHANQGRWHYGFFCYRFAPEPTIPGSHYEDAAGYGWVGGVDFRVADGTTDDFVTDYNVIWGGTPWEISEAQAVTDVVMHELGHNLQIIYWPNGAEVYCENAPSNLGFGHPGCCMASLDGSSALERNYCAAHWAMLRLT